MNARRMSAGGLLLRIVLGLTGLAALAIVGGILFLKFASAAGVGGQIAGLKAGDRLELPPGQHGRLDLKGRAFAGPVTIASADPANPAIFTGGKIENVDNLVLDGLRFEFDPQGKGPEASALEVKFATGMTIRNTSFVGGLVGGYGSGRGLTLTDSSSITVEGSSFSLFLRGALFSQTQDLKVIGNEVFAIRSDGLNFIEVQDVLIEGNHIRDFDADPNSGDHQDFIQFWNFRTKTPSSDIVIRRNVLEIGEGDVSQLIFMGNEHEDDRAMDYRNVLIEDNLIYGAHLHGVTVGAVQGLKVVGNTILQNTAKAPSGEPVYVPAINIARMSANIEVTNNVAHGFIGDHAKWRKDRNLMIRPAQVGAYFSPDMTPLHDHDVGANLTLKSLD